jgi:catechol 2,3-dioxygenase-like lactoylglutathione lyase family enzyme
MIAHLSLNVTEIAASKDFYTKALTPFGYTVAMDMPEYQVVGFMSGEGNRDFWLHGKGTPVERTHVAFGATSEEQVQAFYKAALEAGGKDNGAPGYRTDYGAGYYAAFVTDPNGHNIEAMFWNAAK